MNQINQYPVQATVAGNEDFLDIDKHIGGGVFESQKISPPDLVYKSALKTINAWNGSFGFCLSSYY